MKDEIYGRASSTPSTPSFETALLTHDMESLPSDPYSLLAESLDMLEQFDDEQAGRLRPIVVQDAHDLAVRILPQNAVDLLGLQPKRMDDIGFEQRPNIRALFLLVRSYDATGDPTLHATLEHILTTCPPYMCELVVDAFSLAHQSGKSVMDEFKKLAFSSDQKIDGYVEGRPPFPSS